MDKYMPISRRLARAALASLFNGAAEATGSKCVAGLLAHRLHDHGATGARTGRPRAGDGRWVRIRCT
jgi:hypothetical protein